MESILSYLLTIIVTVVYALVPFSGGSGAVDKDNIRMRAGVVSDTHIDYRLPIGQAFLAGACAEMNLLKPDVFVDLGDLTNYGDAKSMEKHFKITDKILDKDIDEIYLTGNHDIGHSEMSNEDARLNFVRVYNEYIDYKIDKTWFSRDVNGYTFIVLGTEDEDNWDMPEYSDSQLAFLDSEIARGSEGGKPVFVCAHVPLAGIHGEQYYYDGVTEEPYSSAIQNILEKYDNVFFLTGHVHKGLSNSVKTPTYITVNGVHYLTLPSYLMPNWPQGGLTNHGMAFIIEVYDGEVVLRARNCITQKWYRSFEYTEKIK